MSLRPRLIAFASSALLTLSCTFAAEPEFISPDIHADGRVTFNFYAPNARAVLLQGANARTPQAMAKNADGLWTVTVGPFSPDLYSYTYAVDGATVTDPRNRSIKKWIRTESAFEITGTPPNLASSQPGPHGIVHRHVFASRTRQRENAILVYTPPGYDPRGETRYPVVYLLHGFGDDETAWAEVGHANFIADNLIAQRRAVPAVIVMTNGHPVPIPTGGRGRDYGAENNNAMQQELLTEVIPLVEKNYLVRPDAASRAIVGLSMGGGHSLNIGLTHLDTFSWVGGFSSSAPTDNLDRHFAALLDATKTHASEPRLLWIGIGRDDFLLKQNETFIAWLNANHVRHTWNLTDGGHEWPVWRRYLGEFLPLLFR